MEIIYGAVAIGFAQHYLGWSGGLWVLYGIIIALDIGGAMYKEYFK